MWDLLLRNCMGFFLIHEPKYCICIVVCVYLIDRFLWCTSVSFLNLILMHQNPGKQVKLAISKMVVSWLYLWLWPTILSSLLICLWLVCLKVYDNAYMTTWIYSVCLTYFFWIHHVFCMRRIKIPSIVDDFKKINTLYK